MPVLDAPIARALTPLSVKRSIINLCRTLGLEVGYFDRDGNAELLRYQAISTKFRPFTMVPEVLYIDNLQLASLVRHIPGEIVECGVWRGGMSAGLAEILGNQRRYWLFDSFEGLPPAEEIDGPAAKAWQNDPTGDWYFDNCTAEESFARQAMKLAGPSQVQFVKGWFKDTVATASVGRIALLRLDGDWYESTMTCLEAFYPKVADGGMTIIDDYYTWDGCARAVHDYLARNSLTDRIQQSAGGNAFIVKSPPPDWGKRI